MTTWLDTQTEALLQPLGPQKETAVGTVGYSVVLLDGGVNAPLFRRAVGRIHPGNEAVIADICRGPGPWVVRSELSRAEAMRGQFELICADAVSVFLRDEVVRSGEPAYLETLFANLAASPEFEWVRLVFRLPLSDEREQAFWQQFVGPDPTSWADMEARMPLHLRTRRKKARIMHHWVRKYGGTAILTNEPE